MWELNPSFVFNSITVLSRDEALTIGDQTFTSFDYLLTIEGYQLLAGFNYSFYLEIAGLFVAHNSSIKIFSLLMAGACLPFLVTLLSWRLALLIPARTLELEARQQQHQLAIEETSYHQHQQQQLNQSNALQYFAAGQCFDEKSITYSHFPL